MAQNQQAAESAMEIDRLAVQLAKDPRSKVFMPLAEEYGKAGMWQEAAGVLEDGLNLYPGFITAMVALGRVYDHLGQATKAKAILEESVKLSPENLRAHRTLMKIYQSQGLMEPALQSCSLILAINPRDEEALAIQSALSGPQAQKKEPATPAPSELPKSMKGEPEIVSAVPQVAATTSTERAPDPTDQIGELPADLESGSQPAETAVLSSSTPRADVVVQLESWLYRIQSRRHDRDSVNESHPKAS
ncbi:MAG: tetratricopeptide repeat protein [Nitrospirota bacterium]